VLLTAGLLVLLWVATRVRLKRPIVLIGLVAATLASVAADGLSGITVTDVAATGHPACHSSGSATSPRSCPLRSASRS
jgi:hypothetical protein